MEWTRAANLALVGCEAVACPVFNDALPPFTMVLLDMVVQSTRVAMAVWCCVSVFPRHGLFRIYLMGLGIFVGILWASKKSRALLPCKFVILLNEISDPPRSKYSIVHFLFHPWEIVCFSPLPTQLEGVFSGTFPLCPRQSPRVGYVGKKHMWRTDV